MTKTLKCKVGVHQWGGSQWEDKNGKCTESHICNHCMKVIVLQSMNHTWSEWKWEADKCEQSRQCKRCLTSETRPLHDWGEWNLTENADNKVQESRQCKRCFTSETRISPEQEKIAKHISILKAGQPIYDSMNDPKNAARDALKQIGVPAVLPLLADARECRGFPLALILKSLGDIGDLRAFDLFMIHIKSPEWGIRSAAAYGLGQVGKSEATQVLIESLGDSNTVVCEEAAKALGNLKDRRAVEPLMIFARAHQGHGRQRAVTSLGNLNDDRAIDLLIEIASEDHDEFTRRDATAALAKFPPNAIALLNEKLKQQAVKVSPTGHDIYDLMHAPVKQSDEEHPTTLENSEAVLFYATYSDFKNSWVLQIPTGPGRYQYRRIRIDPEQSPDRVVYEILQKAPGWSLSLDSMDRLYNLVTSGEQFDGNNPIRIETYADIYQDRKKDWYLSVHVSREADQRFQISIIDENIGATVKDMIAAAGLHLMTKR
jgi:hypothetical protein